MTVPLARLTAWALQQASSLPDTIVTKQVPNARNWFDIVSGASSVLISIALLTLAFGLLPAAWNFRKSYKKINELLDRVYGDITPIMRHTSSIADNLNYVTTAVRQDVARLQATVAAANASLEEATRLTERRVREFNALLEVVQSEAEGTFVSTASTIRGVRQGAETFRDELLGGIPHQHYAADDAFDDEDDGFEAEPPADDTPGRAPRTRVATATTPSEDTDNERKREDAFIEDGQDERPRIRRPRGGPGSGTRGAT